jgi:hypothetical protein
MKNIAANSESNIYRKKGEIILFAKDNQDNQVEEDEIGGACRTNGGEEERV